MESWWCQLYFKWCLSVADFFPAFFPPYPLEIGCFLTPLMWSSAAAFFLLIPHAPMLLFSQSLPFLDHCLSEHYHCGTSLESNHPPWKIKHKHRIQIQLCKIMLIRFLQSSITEQFYLMHCCTADNSHIISLSMGLNYNVFWAQGSGMPYHGNSSLVADTVTSALYLTVFTSSVLQMWLSD